MAVRSAIPVTDARETPWAITCEGFDPESERGVEAAFTVANGTIGVRAALEEGSAASNPMLVVGGVYVPVSAPAGQTLLRLPDPSALEIVIDGERATMSNVRTTAHARTLDVRHGTLTRSWAFDDGRGRSWRMESLRAASAVDGTCYLHRLALRSERGDAEAAVSIRFLNHGERDGTAASMLRTARVTRGRCRLSGTTISAGMHAGEEIVVESVSRLAGLGGVPGEAPEEFAAHLAAHEQAWARRWDKAGVAVGGNDELLRASRFALYHIWSTAAVNEGRTSIAARNLSGEAYHGHVFWDTDVFILPALIFTWPEAARSCLLYRHRTLDAARARARARGYAGALYAWESTDTGEDRTPSSAVLPDGSVARILTGEMEHHISAAVPYAVMQYWRGTGDDAFLRDYGAEMLFECARFWASRVSPSDHGYSVLKVIGPDEYHVGVDDNAYTNALARWTLQQAAALAARLGDDAAGRAALTRCAVGPGEPDEWRRIASGIVRATFREAGQVAEQFTGFFGLQPVDVASYRRAGVALDIAAGFDAVQRLRTTKQPDVLMSAALLPGAWDEAALRENYDYYEPITAHTSSLSPPVHALLAAWLRRDAQCTGYLQEAARIDTANGYRGAAGGVHIGALGGLWQALVFGAAGFKWSEAGVAFDPLVPESVETLSFALRWRGRQIRVRISRDGTLVAELASGEPCGVRVNRERRLMYEGEQATFTFDPAVTWWTAGTREEGIDER